MFKMPLHAITGVAVFLLLIETKESFADIASPTQVITEIGIGYESQSSPLVRVSPEGTLINLSGNQHMKDGYVRANIQSFTNWPIHEGWGASASGSATLKQARNEKNFDFGSISIQPSIYKAFGSATLSWGLSLARMSIANKYFGDTTATQLNWTLSDISGNLWAATGELAANQHSNVFSELDSKSSSLILQRHLDKPIIGTDAFDFSAYLERDHNKRGFSDLSYRNMMLSMSLQWHWFNIAWIASSTWQKTRYDDIAFEEEPARTDKSIGLGLTAEREFSKNNTLRISYNNVNSASTTAMFNNHYQQVEITICKIW